MYINDIKSLEKTPIETPLHLRCSTLPHFQQTITWNCKWPLKISLLNNREVTGSLPLFEGLPEEDLLKVFLCNIFSGKWQIGNGAHAICGNVKAVRKFANMNTTKHSKYMFISANFRFFLVSEVHDFGDTCARKIITKKGIFTSLITW